MATHRGFPLKPKRLHEVVLTAIDDDNENGCFLFSLRALLKKKKIEMTAEELTWALTEAVRTKRLLLRFIPMGKKVELYICAKHYMGSSNKHTEKCDDPACDNCYPEIFSVFPQ